MTVEIVNLRRVRRRLEREAAAQDAAANRARFGRTRGEREAEAMRAAQAARTLDGARLEHRQNGKGPDQTADANPVENRAKDRDSAS